MDFSEVIKYYVGINVDDNNIVLLTDEREDEVAYEFLDLVEYDGREFVVLLPVEGDEEGEVVILEIEDNGEDTEEQTYVSIEDEAVLMKVFEIFKEKLRDEFAFED